MGTKWHAYGAELQQLLQSGLHFRVIAERLGVTESALRNYVYRKKIKWKKHVRRRITGASLQPAGSMPGPKPVEAVRFDYNALEEADVLITSLLKTGGEASRLRILGSDLLTDLLRRRQLWRSFDYTVGSWSWYLKEGEAQTSVHDTDYIVLFDNGKLMVLSEYSFARRWGRAAAGCWMRDYKK